MPTHKDLPYSREFTDSGARRQESIREFIAEFNRILEGYLDEAFEIIPTPNAKIHTHQVLIDMLGAENDVRYINDHFIYTDMGVQSKHSSAKKVLDWYYEKLREQKPEKYTLVFHRY